MENLYKHISIEQENGDFDWGNLSDEVYQHRQENNQNLHNNINNVIF